MSDPLAIILGSLMCAAVFLAILIGIRLVWLVRVWAEDRRREKEYADAWLRTHPRGRHE